VLICIADLRPEFRSPSKSSDALENHRLSIGTSSRQDRTGEIKFVERFREPLSSRAESRYAAESAPWRPTGTGKTRTVEALAQALHGNCAKFLRIDCGEFQLEHEVAKLIGAPPGYTGHRETQPMLSERFVHTIKESCLEGRILFGELNGDGIDIAETTVTKELCLN